MARLEDIPEPTRGVVASAECPRYETIPYVAGPSLSERRVAIVTSAGLHRRGERPIPHGTPEFRVLPSSVPAADILMSHVSINFDRSGFQRDINVVHPIDRLHELAAERVIGSVAETHYSIMGANDPAAPGMEEMADQIAGMLRQDRVDAVLLTPV